jgi:16S rRNA processing protein RimM
MDMIAIGKIRTSHGVKGFVKIVCYSGETEHFYKLSDVLLKNKNLERVYSIEEMKPHGDSIIIKFEGIDTPEKAKTLSGWEIWVSRDKASSLSKGEYYHADLCQCSFQFENEIIGNVISILEGGASELFEVELTSGKTVLIPFRDEFIGEISIEKKLIELKNKWILG